VNTENYAAVFLLFCVCLEAVFCVGRRQQFEEISEIASERKMSRKRRSRTTDKKEFLLLNLRVCVPVTEV
jgi:hypothetical protein